MIVLLLQTLECGCSAFDAKLMTVDDLSSVMRGVVPRMVTLGIRPSLRSSSLLFYPMTEFLVNI